MPVNVRRLYTSILLTLTALGAYMSAQTPPQAPPADTQTAATTTQPLPVNPPTAAEVMRERISKAKAFIAVRNHNAAVYELENIRRETNDQSVQAVVTVLLMNSYLEQGDYKRAQDFLTQAFNLQKTSKPGASDIYNAVAGQVIKGARSKVERYRSLGLMVSDRNLPLEAVTDIERMRETVELVITQAKENGKEASKANTSMVLLEEATASRSNLARDSYDAQRWKNEVADSREQLANSRSVITNAVDGTTSPNSAPPQTVAVNNPVSQTNVPTAGPSQAPGYQPLVQKTADSRPVNAPHAVPANNKPSDTAVAANNKPAVSEPVKKEEPAKPIVVQNPSRENTETVKQAPPANTTAKADPPKTEAPKTGSATSEGMMDIGSLKEYATKQTLPTYPPAAKSMRTTGIVKVELVINESGDVAEVQSTSGPVLLQSAAKDAARKWKFKPFTRDGQPVRATGFVNFNFSL